MAAIVQGRFGVSGIVAAPGEEQETPDTGQQQDQYGKADEKNQFERVLLRRLFAFTFVVDVCFVFVGHCGLQTGNRLAPLTASAVNVS